MHGTMNINSAGLSTITRMQCKRTKQKLTVSYLKKEANFKCCGKTVINQNGTHKQINSKLKSGNACHCSMGAFCLLQNFHYANTAASLIEFHNS